MRRSRSGRRIRLPLAILALSLVAAACGGGDGDGAQAPAAKTGGTFRLGIVEPTAIDPYNSQESEGILVTRQLYNGLVGINNDTLELTPAVAEKWTSDDKCNVWTFNLRQGTTFSNGEAVTAQSFIDGWTRVASKDAASDVAYHLAGIDGYEALNTKGAKTFSGVTAPDPNTLVVKLSAPDCEFDRKTLHSVYSPVSKEAGAFNNKQHNDLPIGNGPFKMEGPWDHDNKITLVRNDSYFGEKPKIDRVEIAILPSETAQELEYKNLQGGQADYSRIPPQLYGQAEAKYKPQGGFIREDTNGINYLLPNVKNPPLNNVDARKAISYAIDRDKIISGVFKGYQTKATAFIPPIFGDYYQAGVCEACAFDVAKAKELAAKGGLKPGTELKFAFNTGGGHEAWVQAVAQQLKENLGLKVKIEPYPFAELLEKEQAPNASGLFRAAWGADYPTPDNFLYPLLSKASIGLDNRGRYDNPAFDAELAKERATKDPAVRLEHIQAAEKIAIGQDLALIPLWNRTQYRAFDATKWTGVELDFFENPTLVTAAQK
ncbi:MAG TPA: ABC transporter substrate-binding protein [Actinomycetes bacterium]|jgi:peptide/nickel transport system substrate-binding protein/oligopeptide transport system substrate-binding protein|nr:ABC transporter substrate-binding protein [Actinomycetes bacterium]